MKTMFRHASKVTLILVAFAIGCLSTLWLNSRNFANAQEKAPLEESASPTPLGFQLIKYKGLNARLSAQVFLADGLLVSNLQAYQ